jgi:cell division protein FtsQ
MNAVVKPLDVRLMNFAALLLGLVAVSVFLAHSVRWAFTLPIFGTTRIVVDGDVNHNNALTIKANVAGRIEDSFFFVDLLQVRSVFESIPWVRRAVVRREFPNRLRVTLEEHRSSGFWGGESESRMINSFGEIFDANVGDAESEALPRLIGVDAQAVLILNMYTRLSSLLRTKHAAIEQLELTGRNAWKMQLDTGAQIELGRGNQDDVLARFERFLISQERVLATYGRADLARIESVDLRNGQGYAIRISGVTTAIPLMPIKK